MSKKPELEPKIEEQSRDFDVCALVRLLEEIGYTNGAVQRAGYPASAPQPAWLDSVHFRHDEGDSVTILANLGLMSCRTPLPVYFKQLMEDPAVREPLEELLGLLDDRLLERRFASYEPERHPELFPDWTRARGDLLRLSALRSPSSLHWLFGRVFPELRVTVRRAAYDRWMDAPDVRLGWGRLGDAALGGEARLPLRGVEVTLLSETRLSSIPGDSAEAGVTFLPWGHIGLQRLHDQVFPILRDTGVELTVVLLILDREAAAHLKGEIIQGLSYIGYDPLKMRRRILWARRLIRRGRKLLHSPKRRFGLLSQRRRFLLRCRLERVLVPAPPARIVLFSGPIPAE